MTANEELQKEVQEYQMSQQQLQIIMNQKVQSTMQIREVKDALEELRTAAPGTDVFKSIGRVLIKADIGKLKKELSDDAETIDVRIKSLEKQEKKLKDKMGNMEKTLLPQLQKAKQG